MKCEVCSIENTVVNIPFVTISYCGNFCIWPSYEYCQHENSQLVRKDTTIRKQCLGCGELFGHFVSTKTTNINTLPDYSILQEKYLERHEEKDVLYRKFQINYKLKRKEFEQSNIRHEDETRKQKYKLYLESPRWKYKRKKVLERDKGICQACLEEKAIEVHHLTYKNVFHEPLFDLVSICIGCHTKIHGEKSTTF